MCVHGNQYKHVCINKSVQLLVWSVCVYKLYPRC